MKIVVASGKGGTGKTLIALSLAKTIKDCLLMDADVDAPNDNLFLNIDLNAEEDVYKHIPQVKEEKCTKCGTCSDLCEYNAIAVFPNKVLVTPELCHGCGLCARACPENAITMKDFSLGQISSGSSTELPQLKFVEGRLKIGEAMTSGVIKEMKKRHLHQHDTIIIDSPPGSACPVVESIRDMDFVLLVTEATPFGLHDLKVSIDLVKVLDIPHGIVINKSDLGYKKQIEHYAEENNIPILLNIPYKKEFAELYSNGILIVDRYETWKEKFLDLFDTIKGMI